MKNSGHGEKTVHIITTVGFFLTSLIFMIFPNLFTIQSAFIVLFFLLGLKTIGDIIVDSHNTLYYRSKK